MSKLGMVLAAATGYVLGARAGRQRYEQIQQQAQRLWTDPRVQKKKAQAQELAREKGTQAQELAREKGAQVRDKVKDASSTDSSSDAGAAGQHETGSPSASGSGPHEESAPSGGPHSPTAGRGDAAGTAHEGRDD